MMDCFLILGSLKKTWLLNAHAVSAGIDLHRVSFSQVVAYLASVRTVFKTGSGSKRMPFPASRDASVFYIPETDVWMEVPIWEMR